MRIALLEDEPEQARNIVTLLSDNQHSCESFQTGQSFLSAVTHRSYDLLILDWQIPDSSGIEVLRHVRAQLNWPIPVIFLTQRDSEQDIVQALDAGADDYLSKPARPAELLARISALARRTQPDVDRPVLEYGHFRIDTKSRTIHLRNELLTLTDKDFDLTLFLFQNQGRLLTREMLLERVWGVTRDINTRTVDTHMSRLRRRLGVKPENGFRIKTIYQRGYRLETMDEQPSEDAVSDDITHSD
ncbi:MAG: DNA-binding response regulator [Alteromonadaceae bacterium]|uniref:response regulator transcription factor n=1 Tax=unclassified Marinobacter TaxID=83889 RepID=UPI000C387EE8|nr:response regulator transcription factor [Marinobacter sp. BGYM27]MAA64456.1 DNA-binding response regulator [Alteromonadaceae bacterium]MBH85902.1 DNA-binding response regulator [Alteromonadaceae bacterium]MBH87521.1 DNA-binding response regulator [Alteromonadaceae bacterium]MDG5498689.1 response regulator transcription factor [Marinobacter sp. BGYM27]|tara:strand:+ start:66458 stop:67189 length:732 start_codon:yes stop_codon:yes gene_type:complete